MASINIRVGDKIYLHLQLYDNDTTKYIRAILKDASGATLPASPVNLTHDVNGLYVDDSVIMPDSSHVIAQYLVYDDAGYTILSSTQGSDVDIFNQIPPAFLDPSIEDVIINIDNNVDSLLNQGLSTTVLHFTGEIVSLENLAGIIDPTSTIMGLIEPSTTLVGYLDPETIDLNILQGEMLEGEIP